MALGDLYRLLYRTRSGEGIDCLNVFYYENLIVGGSAATLNGAFVDELLPLILDVVNVAQEVVNMESINLYDETDFHVSIYASGGNRVGTYLPAFVGYAFRLNRASRALRNGRKTFAGVTEEDIEAAGEPVVAFQPVLDALAVGLSAELTDPVNGSVWRPRIVRLDPVTGLPQITIGLSSAQFVRVSSQNSRKT